MSSFKYKCPVCGAVSTPIMWMEETASNLGVQYRSVRHIDRASVSSTYVCPECHAPVTHNKIVKVPVSMEPVRKKIYKQVIADVKKGMESIHISQDKSDTGYLFTFEKDTNIATSYNDVGKPRMINFIVGSVSLPEVVLKDGSKNTDHQHKSLDDGLNIIVSYNIESDRLSYTLTTKEGSPVFNIGELIQGYEAKIAEIQGTKADTTPMIGIFTKDDRYVEHCSDCPERYSCPSVELRPEYRRR